MSKSDGWQKPSEVTKEDRKNCLYHAGKDCICIRPVRTQEQLAKRVASAEALAKFGLKT